MQKTTSPDFSNSMAAGAQSDAVLDGMSSIGTPRSRSAFAVPGEPTNVNPREASFAASSANFPGECILRKTVFPFSACFFVGILTQEPSKAYKYAS